MPKELINELSLWEHPSNDTIIFCDPGKDDAAMLAQVFSSPALNVLGVIPSAGNATLENSVQNTLRICELTDREDIKVYPGARVPIGQVESEMEHAAGAHGLTGFGTVKLPDPAMQAQPEKGVDFAVAAIKNAKRTVTLISTGGLTDVYETLQRLKDEAPDALKNIAAISLMGGVFERPQANAPVARDEDLTTAFQKQYAEFNAIFDPIATAGVFRIAEQENIKILLAPLDLTHRALSHHEDAVKLREVGNRVASTMADFIEDVGPWDIKRFGLDENQKPMVPVHDASASTALLHPELFQGEWVSVRGVGEGPEKGKTEITKGGPKNVFKLELPPERLDAFHAAFREDMRAYDHLRDKSHLPEDLAARTAADLARRGRGNSTGFGIMH